MNGRRLFARARIGVALKALLPAAALLLAGCAMSEQSYGRLSSAVSQRNEERYRTAEAAMRAKGYRFVDDELLHASLDIDAMERCDAYSRRSFRRPATDDQPLTDAGLVVHVAPSARADRPPPVPIELRVAERDACELFSGNIRQLDVKKPDGSAARMVIIPAGMRLARDRSGLLVLVTASSRVVSQRTVLVDRSCDHMPGGERRPMSLPVVFASVPPPTIEMVVEREELDAKCTSNTY
jgi:hypothetical protein